ncbi:Transcriptional regulator, TetR family OS=Tsukamurella paurometabola (strain ATCC 8368 / DSM/ CCUG 35730 / CIP 100753 / JCM 10117 / KCTC 9821 / NBRC 16120/ NCIMB 702349 / NCTC 13040) OX=521096 GN=Tpau_2596 PE=4 SV=1 [Tsukamurella paurometabola]|uniref:Transcriptional regulator, TetR family n=1 Tax=Tsukamurella paurometabola (strain ATCC 8368 / DSM 20162 / CCUG 35730 / CIP 100753 / JCM 10117 / KCTC 9821 / NBRC 16120 / NCIMB 702349 / NCTC 13040) TaxID=521096 RepID=D5URZ4_TSUPD|nr:TetR/AcrR family transcriptional regulator [Tsukamurella paurometabola]ADG79199.1 transcriptional regulator, TetR family [Tsukamurella paurometabola DSM 20162]SUP34513.1 transcriptional repressor BetI [Tsukamurella paurometabola]
MNASRTARERARAEITAEITARAREQLRDVGAAALSLRAVARDLGLASSAVYRYFPSRDALLTALITDAYTALGDAVEQADAAASTPRERWRACGHAVRNWARDHPHEYALIFGSPVPGYAAPRATIAAAIRTSGTFARIAADGHGEPPEVTDELRSQLDEIAEAVAPEADRNQLALGVLAWTQLFGIVSFEIFGQFANTLDPADEFFGYALDRIANQLGL